MEIWRAQVMHTPRDPFTEGGALEAFSDGGLAFADGRIEAVGSFDQIRAAYPDADVRDERDAVLVPGFVDTHVHFPQLAIMGSMGLSLLDWLERYALPEEVRMADPEHARRVAREFVAGLAGNGTTTALVFGSHFPAAQEALFDAAERSGLRIASGLVVSDRNLRPELHVDPEHAYEAGRELAERWHGRGRLRYAVTPRFSLSCTEGMLEACGALHGEVGALVTSHMNENVDEVAAVRAAFDGFDDYLHTYEHFGLVGESTVLAHNDHPSERELARLGAARASVAHCPESNAFLGSGLFPMRDHLDHGVRVALGTDVGAGTGLSMLKEALTAYQLQMLRPDPPPIGPAHLLYLSTRAGARALGMDDVGDLSPGKAADLVLLRPPPGSTLEAVLRHSDSPERTLGALFALAREESVVEVRIAGEAVTPGTASQAPPGGTGGASPPNA